MFKLRRFGVEFPPPPERERDKKKEIVLRSYKVPYFDMPPNYSESDNGYITAKGFVTSHNDFGVFFYPCKREL